MGQVLRTVLNSPHNQSLRRRVWLKAAR